MRSVRASAGGLGFLVLCVGVWGGIVAFVGPTFAFDIRGAATAWSWTQSHATLSVAPAICAVLGGMLMMAASTRTVERLGAMMALVAGAWFVIGPSLQPLWASSPALSGPGSIGTSGSTAMRALEAIGYFYGTGAVLMLLAALVLGLVAVPMPATASPAAAGKVRVRSRIHRASHA